MKRQAKTKIKIKVKERAFFDLAKRFRKADNPNAVKQLGDKLGRFIFGE